MSDECHDQQVNAKIASEVQGVVCKSISSLGANFLQVFILVRDWECTVQDAVSSMSTRMKPYIGAPDLEPGRGEAAAVFISEPLVNYQTNPRFRQLQNFAQMLDGSFQSPETNLLVTRLLGAGSPAALPVNEWVRKLLPGGRYAVVHTR